MEMRHRQTGDVQPAVASDAHEQPEFATSQLAKNLGSLAQLHKDGSLTDDEFARAKATALATDEKGAVAGGPQIAVHLSAAGSKLAAAGRVVPAWACRPWVALLVYAAVVGIICAVLPTADAALHKAVIGGTDHTVKSLLEQGADPDHGERAAVPLVGHFLYDEAPLSLYKAATNGHTATVEAMLAAGARPDAGGTYGPFGSIFSATPLLTDAANGQTAIVEALNLNLAAAGHRGQTAVVEALLAAGARADAMTIGPFGSVMSGTPLHKAALNGRAAVVEALLAARARLGVGITVGAFTVSTPLR